VGSEKSLNLERRDHPPEWPLKAQQQHALIKAANFWPNLIMRKQKYRQSPGDVKLSSSPMSLNSRPFA
jgi:hypothetical protein